MSSLLRLLLPETGQVATDERCSCGHPRSEHDDRFATFDDEAVRVPGGGRCCEPGCACQRFRFASWIVEPLPSVRPPHCFRQAAPEKHT
jgi:hypothetical protein